MLPDEGVAPPVARVEGAGNSDELPESIIVAPAVAGESRLDGAGTAGAGEVGVMD
jgi:hypothetical protein